MGKSSRWLYYIVFWITATVQIQISLAGNTQVTFSGKREIYVENQTILQSYFLSCTDSKLENVRILFRDADSINLQAPFQNDNLISRKYINGKVDASKFVFGLKGDLFILKAESGLRFYKFNGTTFQPLIEDPSFHDLYGWTAPISLIMWGNIFPHPKMLGLFTRDSKGVVRIHVVREDLVMKRDNLHALQQLSPPQFPGWWSNKDTTLSIVKLRETEQQEYIAASSPEVLALYKLNGQYNLEKYTEVLLSKGTGGLLQFARISGSQTKDIVLTNSSGFYIWELDKVANKFTNFVNYNKFGINGNEMPVFLDIDGDSKEEILYCASSTVVLKLAGGNGTQHLEPTRIKGLQNNLCPKATFSCGSKSLVLLEDDDDNLTISEVNVIKIPPIIISPLQIPTTAVTPTYQPHPLPKLAQNPKPIQISWADIILPHTLPKEIVDLQTGQIQFELPLVSSPEVELNLSYNGNNQISTILGTAWGLPLTRDYITVERSSTISEDDDEYYLALGGILYPLEGVGSSASEKTYRLASNAIKNYTVSYFPSLECWTVKKDSVTFTFGKTAGEEDAVQVSLFSPSSGYNVKVGDARELISQPVSWFLKKIQSSNESGMQYIYSNAKGTVSGKSYTKSIHLKQMKSILSSFSATFTYSWKQTDEYLSPTPVSADGQWLSFPIPLAESQILDNLEIQAPGFIQKFKFQYKSIQQRQVLENIYQLQDTYQSIATFEYKSFGERILMTKRKLYKNPEENVDYEEYVNDKEDPVELPLYSKEGVNIESDFLLLHSHNVIRDTIQFQVYGLDGFNLLQELETPRISGKVKSYSVHIHKEAVSCIILASDNSSRVELFSLRNRTSWTHKITFSFPKSVKMFPSKEFIAVVIPNEGKLHIIEPENTSTFHMPNLDSENTLTAVGPNFIVIYDDILVNLVHRKQSVWSTTKITGTGGILGSTKMFLDKFDISEHERSNIYARLMELALQVNDNRILISSVNLDGDTSYLNLRLIKLSPTFDHTISRTRNRLQDLLSLSRKVDGNEGWSFTFGYSKEGGKYKVQGKDVHNKKVISTDEKKNALKDINKRGGDWEKLLRNMTLVDWSLHFAYLTAKGILKGDGKTFIEMDGSEDKVPSVSTFRAGSYLRLESRDSGISYSIKVENGRALLNFTVNGSIFPTFPYFIAYQEDLTTLVVIPFTEGGRAIGSSHFIQNELLHPLTGTLGLVTTRRSGRFAASHEIVIRPFSTFKNRTIHKVGKVQVGLGLERRAMGYKFENHKSTVVPGGDTRISGWVEHLWPKTGKGYQVRLMNSKGKEVTLINKTRQDPAPKLLNRTQITDKSGKLSIRSAEPHNLEMVDYIGFENYETSRKWVFDSSHIVTGGFALTGKSYLELSNGTSIRRIFRPADTNGVYVASAWIRISGASVELDSDTPFFKAIYLFPNNTELVGILGRVRKVEMEWFYAEIILDFPFAIEEIYQENMMDVGQIFSNVNRTITPSEVEVAVKLIIDSSDMEQKRIQIDNIQFSPIDFSQNARVYHTSAISKPLPAATIGNKGDITRFHYHKGERIAETNENYNVTYLISKCLGNQSSILRMETTEGLYESWNPTTFKTRWRMESSPDSFSVSPGSIYFEDALRSGNIKLIHPPFTQSDSLGLRFNYNLITDSASLQLNFGLFVISISGTGRGARIDVGGQTVEHQPAFAELILVIVEGKRVLLWIDGASIIDRRMDVKTPSFTVKFKGKSEISSLFLLNDPSLQLTYLNPHNQPTQILQLLAANEILLTETLYDKLGRPSVKTKKTKISESSPSLLKSRSNFVTNKNPYGNQSIWHTGRLNGDILKYYPLDAGTSFYQEEYEKYPNGPVLNQGIPGEDYTLGNRFGPRNIQNKRHDEIAFITNLFPPSTHDIKSRKFPNGKEVVWVYNKEALLSAVYVKAPTHDDTLTTYEYKHGKVSKILPPSYHEAEGSLSRTESWVGGSDTFMERNHGTFFDYDQEGRLTRKSSRDLGTVQFLYDPAGNVRFRVHQPFGSLRIDKIVYTIYDRGDELASTGLYTENITEIRQLEKYLWNPQLPLTYTNEYQKFFFSNDDFQPSSRGRVKSILTFGESYPIVEELEYDRDNLVSKKTILSLPTELSNRKDNDNEVPSGLTKSWTGQRTQKVCYDPTFCLILTNNRLGQLVSLQSENSTTFSSEFSYNADGQVESEKVNGVKRSFSYNSPGFLTEIEDNLFSEKISYTEKGYTQSGQGAGLVTKYEFHSKWVPNKRNLKLVDEHPRKEIPLWIWKMCLNALKRTGYLTALGAPGRPFVQALENSLPVLCTGGVGNKLAAIMEEISIPSTHGYKLDYGSHGEIIRAKYYANINSTLPALQPYLFSKSLSISLKSSIELWKKLVAGGYLIENHPTLNITSHLGYQGVSPLFREEVLEREVKMVDPHAGLFSDAIVRLLANYLLDKQQTISLPEFSKKVSEWSGHLDHLTPQVLINKGNVLSKEVFDMLVSNKLTGPDFLHADFIQMCKPHNSIIIAKVIRDTQNLALGSHPYDLESLKIDSNGNRMQGYTGFRSYNVTYNRVSPNQVETVTMTQGNHQNSFRMKHDSEGNVVQALHNGISHIEYDAVSLKPNLINLVDGRTLSFLYDGQGERIQKRVYSADGNLTKEITYLRDETGRVYTEKESLLTSGLVKETTTHYVYGPRGLLGFVRDRDFYRVTTDHAGSVKLVTKRGEVVSAYDYFPYGELQKSYQVNNTVELRYRFVGKEWDEESGLYNFHARLYDPTLGRFFQTDPQSQYPSPYVYAGNSPVSLVDPDGELAWFIVIPFIIGGTYLGGAAVNENWNPVRWDYKNPMTYVGIIGGGVAGGFLPAGFGASAALIGTAKTVALGAGVGYLSTAAANGNFNPAIWKWENPSTYNAFFQGFAIGSSLPAGFVNMNKLATKLAGESTKLRGALVASNYLAGGGVAYGMGVVANDGNPNFIQWDWTSPTTYNSLLTGFYSGYSIPTIATGAGKGMTKLVKTAFSPSSPFKSWKSFGSALKSTLRNPKSPVYIAAGAGAGAYLMGSISNENFDPSSWNFKSFTTYQGILNGAFMGGGLFAFRPSKKTPHTSNVRYESIPAFMKTPGFSSALTDVVFKMSYSKYTWIGKIVRPISAAKALLPKAMYKFKRQLSSLIKKERKPVKVDRNVGVSGVVCAGRSKRGILISSPRPPIPCAMKATAVNREVMAKFRDDLPTFLTNNPLTFWNLNTAVNNEIVQFQFHKLTGNRGYGLKGVRSDFNLQNAVKGYYLATSNVIEIPAFPNTRHFSPLVITNEMQGCTLYAKFIPETRSIRIFHHNREDGAPLVLDSITQDFIVDTVSYHRRERIVTMGERFTDAIAIEEYTAARRLTPDTVQHANIFVNFDNTRGEWTFTTQKISFVWPHPGNNYELKNLVIDGVASRRIRGIPSLEEYTNSLIIPDGT